MNLLIIVVEILFLSTYKCASENKTCTCIKTFQILDFSIGKATFFSCVFIQFGFSFDTQNIFVGHLSIFDYVFLAASSLDSLLKHSEIANEFREII